jgi:cell division protein DivIC
MTQTNTKKTKKTKKRKITPFVKLICFIIIGTGCFGIYSGVKEITTYFSLQQQVKEANTRYQEVQDENSYYTSEKEKLQDPDYVQSYARSNYMLSKDGEQIFYLPEKDN